MRLAMSLQRSRESTALHVDYYSTTKKTANPTSGQTRRATRCQATIAHITRIVPRPCAWREARERKIAAM
jgi:hypothetical protein